jgi:tetratricopeptide (TPR) repeat protein
MAETCLEEKYSKYIPDNYTQGVLYFFLGVLYLRLSMIHQALTCFEACQQTSWKTASKNEFLIHFVLAKTHQALLNHKLAIQYYNIAIDLEPKNPYCYFRRAWSYKVC